ncbi:MAG: recombinase family protein [Maricaulaceae bacterium]
MLIGYACETPDGPDLSDQLRDLVRAGCGPIFIEKLNDQDGDHYNDRGRDRAELAKAVGVTRAGDALVAPRLDRLADDLSALIETLETLRARTVSFVSVAERLDTRLPGAGGAVYHLVAALAAFDRSVGSKPAVGAARPRGATPKLSEADIEKAKQMLAKGEHTVAEIAKQLGVSRPTLYRHLPRARSSSRS